MRNSTLASPTFAQWLTSRGSGGDASPNWGDDDFEYRQVAGSSIGHERMAVLANEILTAAIKLAAVLEMAQRPDRRHCGNSHPEQTGGYVDE